MLGDEFLTLRGSGYAGLACIHSVNTEISIQGGWPALGRPGGGPAIFAEAVQFVCLAQKKSPPTYRGA